MTSMNVSQIRMGRSVAMNRAYDYLNVGFGFHNAPRWMPVYATFQVTAFGLAQGKVFSEEAYK